MIQFKINKFNNAGKAKKINTKRNHKKKQITKNRKLSALERAIKMQKSSASYGKKGCGCKGY